jgi:predicted membrane protein
MNFFRLIGQLLLRVLLEFLAWVLGVALFIAVFWFAVRFGGKPSIGWSLVVLLIVCAICAIWFFVRPFRRRRRDGRSPPPLISLRGRATIE